ncbi:MAG: DUF3078 domain-containing protein [Bacteroidetes bacterium]|nr:DUF3078 domain-containing protein [Bacteroidota bacterium]
MQNKFRNYKIEICYILILFTIKTFGFNAKDSSRKSLNFPNTITYSNNFSASYVHYKNWKYNGNNNYSFLVRSAINYDSIGNFLETHIRFNGELGYMKFVDSVWYKNSDCIDFSTEIIKKTNKQFENIFTFYFNSQFLSTYENQYHDSGYYYNRWVSGFGNPMNIDLGYGTTFRFWKTSRINLTFVTLRTSTSPILDFEPNKQQNDIIYNKTLITSEYGIGLQTYIRKSFGSKVRWENYSRCFANAINRSKFDIDFRNRIIVKIFKYLDLIFDNRIRYMPYPPYKFQFRNEIMLSFTFEKI